MATTSLDISHQVDLKGNAILAKDLVLTGTIYSTGGTSPRVKNSLGATLALTQTDAGSTIIFDRLAGTTVTLPAPVLGTSFEFFIGAAPTSNTDKIITDAGTTFLTGGVFIDKSLTVTRYAANGSSHLSINMDGSTMGGALGSYVRLRCTSATEWTVEGTLVASGTLASPFATS